ncbi:helix-turn-helix domain-containing protein [Streptomyces spiramenti]|uniref:Helix-turn-helix domain-containing protein n=1 Tax=Streptomyces spiramenti TaxID=2720606 RepID=A0ABX1APF9_9ACTN|nr:helix-turn-helix transcriptional regulator [Streptomyces spiramenti]NJP66558.1 helix-turn-helix domain-containing protein [Streptomyces spiramenti]
MPPRSTPSERQKRLGAELRRMRADSGETTAFAARLLGLDRTKISNMEAGVRVISPERVRTLAGNYGCTDDRYIDALAAMAEPQEPGWWEGYRGQLPAGLLDIAEIEWHARSVRAAVFLHVPGLLQTRGYARTVAEAALPQLAEREVELRVALRLERRQVLERATPVRYTAYIHEAALRIDFGGPEVMTGQLRWLCEVGQLSHVDVRVVPFTAGAFPGAGQAFCHVREVVPQLDTVQLDSAHGPGFTHAPAQLQKYWSQLDWMERASLSAEASRDLIQHIARN